LRHACLACVKLLWDTKKIFVIVRGRELWECFMSVSPKVTTTPSNSDVAFNGEEKKDRRGVERI